VENAKSKNAERLTGDTSMSNQQQFNDDDDEVAADKVVDLILGADDAPFTVMLSYDPRIGWSVRINRERLDATVTKRLVGVGYRFSEAWQEIEKAKRRGRHRENY
jgi:hypothetical protein